jgi:hypothetical protein
MSKKLDEVYLQRINEEDSLKYFGDWVNHTDELNLQFKDADPFPYVVVKNFLNEEYAEKIYSLFPTDIHDAEKWHKYCNPIEVKYANDNINSLPEDIKNFFYHLSSNQLVDVMSRLTGIKDLEYDEYLHGAGLHIHPKYGRLSVHLDYEKHPISGKERQTNIILFMTKDWNPSWGGANELWDKNAKECVVKTNIQFNTAIIFKTNDISWHGLPEIISCPEDVFRKSLAFYYVSPLNSQKSEDEYRLKAKFVKRPTDITSSGIDHLYEIRPHRRITKEDMEQHAPDWRMEDV